MYFGLRFYTERPWCILTSNFNLVYADFKSNGWKRGLCCFKLLGTFVSYLYDIAKSSLRTFAVHGQVDIKTNPWPFCGLEEHLTSLPVEPLR